MPMVFGLLLGSSACSPRRSADPINARLPEFPANAASLSPMLSHVSKVVVMSELSPAILVRSDSKTVSFFVPDAASKSVAPRFVAFGANGPKIVTNGWPATVSKMQERWILAWFSGAPGWEKMDCPVGIFLQYPLSGLTLNSNGLRLEFAQRAGDIAVMPLYGMRLLPTSLAEFAAQAIPRDEAKTLPRVWEWSQAVTRSPLTRLRYWSSALTRYPLEAWGCYETDVPKVGEGRFSARFSWHFITNSWEIPPLRVAPMSAELSEATLRHSEQHTFSSTPFDMEWPSLRGALRTVSESDHYSVVFRSAKSGQDASSSEWWWKGLGREVEERGQQHVSDRVWVPWHFRSSLAAEEARMPLRLREGSSVMELVSTNSAGRFARSLGAILAGETEDQAPTLERLNSDTVVWRWEQP